MLSNVIVKSILLIYKYSGVFDRYIKYVDVAGLQLAGIVTLTHSLLSHVTFNFYHVAFHHSDSV